MRFLVGRACAGRAVASGVDPRGAAWMSGQTAPIEERWVPAPGRVRCRRVLHWRSRALATARAARCVTFVSLAPTYSTHLAPRGCCNRRCVACVRLTLTYQTHLRSSALPGAKPAVVSRMSVLQRSARDRAMKIRLAPCRWRRGSAEGRRCSRAVRSRRDHGRRDRETSAPLQRKLPAGASQRVD